MSGTDRVPRAYLGADRAAPRGVQGGNVTAVRPPGPDGDGTGSVVVFLIGMRVNRWRRVRSWWPTFVGMPRMLAELQADPGAGLLGARTYWSGRNFMVVQYWKGVAELGSYARDPARLHQPAWGAFNRRSAARGDVGIWHETYVVRAADIESLYGNMPLFGLGAALGVESRSRHRRTQAQDDMGQQDPEYAPPASA